MEVSAKTLFFINELFFLSQTLVLYPVRPILDLHSNHIRSTCLLALYRIFRVHDKDGDGVLDDEEINRFQEKVFGGARLGGEDIGALKKVVGRLGSSGHGSASSSSSSSLPPFAPGLASSLSSILDVDDGQPLQDNKFTPTGFVKPLLPLVLL